MHRDGCTCRLYTIKSYTPHTHSNTSVERVGMCDKLWCISFFVCVILHTSTLRNSRKVLWKMCSSCGVFWESGVVLEHRIRMYGAEAWVANECWWSKALAGLGEVAVDDDDVDNDELLKLEVILINCRMDLFLLRSYDKCCCDTNVKAIRKWMEEGARKYTGDS